MNGESAHVSLPSALTEGATVRGNEHGWTLDAFPSAARIAPTLEYACLGGEFQFRLPNGTYEMYWLSVDSQERARSENWHDYCERSCAEVLAVFTQRIEQIDFREQADQFKSLRDATQRGFDPAKALTFVAYFVTEREYEELQRPTD